jgi:hypothetical protein
VLVLDAGYISTRRFRAPDRIRIRIRIRILQSTERTVTISGPPDALEFAQQLIGAQLATVPMQVPP